VLIFDGSGVDVGVNVGMRTKVPRSHGESVSDTEREIEALNTPHARTDLESESSGTLISAFSMKMSATRSSTRLSRAAAPEFVPGRPSTKPQRTNHSRRPPRSADTASIGEGAAGEDRGGCLSSRAYARLSHSPLQQATVDSAQADSVFSSMLQLEGPT